MYSQNRVQFVYSLINILPRTKLYNISVAIVCDVSLTSIESDIAAFIALKTLFHHVIITEHYGEISRKNVQTVQRKCLVLLTVLGTDWEICLLT